MRLMTTPTTSAANSSGPLSCTMVHIACSSTVKTEVCDMRAESFPACAFVLPQHNHAGSHSAGARVAGCAAVRPFPHIPETLSGGHSVLIDSTCVVACKPKDCCLNG